jgi:hypothetical protein
VYLSNADRIRLGLLGYGSDVPDDVVAAAEAALVGGACPAPAPKPTTKKRARTDKGQFQGDDLATTDTNEAWEEPSA